jgi:hypothetical protein
MWQHFKDALLTVVTLMAAGVLAAFATLLAATILPDISETAAATVYCVAMLLAGCMVGNTLMQHLKWSWRFRIFLLGLPALAVLGVIVDAASLQPSMTLAERLILAPQQRPGPLVVAAGALIGAALARRRAGIVAIGS